MTIEPHDRLDQIAAETAAEVTDDITQERASQLLTDLLASAEIVSIEVYDSPVLHLAAIHQKEMGETDVSVLPAELVNVINRLLRFHGSAGNVPGGMISVVH